MKIKNWIYLLLIFQIVVSACKQLDDDMMSDGGRFNITFSDGKSEQSRSLPSELSDELVSEFYLTINSINGTKAYNGNYSDFQAKQPAFKAGDYYISATLGNNQLLALDSPYYESEKELATIEIEKVTDVKVVCYVANSLASFTFADKDQVKSIFSSYEFVTRVNDTEVSCTADDGKNPYFRAGENVSFILRGTTISGNSVDYTFASILNVEKGKNYKYTISLGNADAGMVDFDITVDETIDDVIINETVPESWLPKPSVSADGFNEQGLLEYTETNDAVNAVINIQAYRPIENIKFTFDFADRNLASLSKTYELATLTAEDKTALEAAGIVLPELETTTGTFNFTNIISGLLCADDGSSVDNNINISVLANGRWSDEKQYTIRTLKPEFGVTIYPGNIWTKEFTVTSLMPENVIKGNYEKLSKNIKYQFSTDGQLGWTDINSEDLTKYDLTPGTEYFVRPVYRNVIAGTVSTVSTYPIIELENGELENYSILSGDDSSASGGAVYAWTGWATLNEISTPTGIACYSFNSRSGCRPTEDSKVGNAVRVITLGYGIGGFAKPKHAMHSKLYLGKSADKNGSGVESGISYASRPTSLSFWYKCISNKGNDQSYAKVQILHDDIVLGESEFFTNAISDYTYKDLVIDYTQYLENLDLIPNKIFILFQSGIKESLDIDSDLKSFIGKLDTIDKTADATFRGNEFFIDDISLVYDK